MNPNYLGDILINRKKPHRRTTIRIMKHYFAICNYVIKKLFLY